METVYWLETDGGGSGLCGERCKQLKIVANDGEKCNFLEAYGDKKRQVDKSEGRVITCEDRQKKGGDRLRHVETGEYRWRHDETGVYM